MIGFIGLGGMGSRMATRLLQANYPLGVYDRTSTKARDLAQLGARVYSTPTQVARDADVVLLMLADDAAVEQVVLGPGHASAIWGLVLAPDGQLVASSGADENVRLWDPTTGLLKATLRGHTGAVWSLAVGADGHLVVSGGEDGSVRLWDSDSERPLVTLQGHTGGVWNLALSSVSRILASGGADGTVRICDTESGTLKSTLRGHTSMVWAVALSADGTLLASGSEDRAIRLGHF
jgi:WD40 repeat protein